LTYKVTYCVFAIDHLLISLVNLLKTIATTGAIFNLQFTKNRLAACSDLLWELERSPRPYSCNRGLLLKGEGGKEGRGKGGQEKREGEGGDGKERKGKGRKGRRAEGGEGRPP